MPRIVSIETQVKQISGLTENDLSEWEQDFVESICERTSDGNNCSSLTEKQLAIIERIWQKHFA